MTTRGLSLVAGRELFLSTQRPTGQQKRTEPHLSSQMSFLPRICAASLVLGESYSTPRRARGYKRSNLDDDPRRRGTRQLQNGMQACIEDSDLLCGGDADVHVRLRSIELYGAARSVVVAILGIVECAESTVRLGEVALRFGVCCVGERYGRSSFCVHW